jgi:hypothetical protein
MAVCQRHLKGELHPERVFGGLFEKTPKFGIANVLGHSVQLVEIKPGIPTNTGKRLP